MTDLENAYKLNRYFYMDSNQNWVIHSDFECVIDPVTKEHSFVSGGYYLECRNNKFSIKVQTFYDLKEYTISLIKELVYIDDIESNYL